MSYGPAVIGVTDDRDRATGNVLAGLTFSRLDVSGPPATTPVWEEAPRLMRLVAATCGEVVGCTFRGGMIELAHGPWKVAANQFEGAVAGTFAHGAVAVHAPHDVAITGNRVRQVDLGGKLWRFLVLTGRGAEVTVADNDVSGVGPRDVDAHPHPNAPETILTESYRLGFEGKPASVSSGGRVVTTAAPQGDRPGPGAVVAILSGPQVGQWRRVVATVGPNAYWLDRPVDLRGGAISIGPGFVATRFERNTVDDRGGSVALPLVLAGGHYGTRVADNRLSGGGEALRAVAAASERPVHWGWSHTPVFGLVVEGNTFADARVGLSLSLDRGGLVRETDGRRYFEASATGNNFTWSGRRASRG